MLVQISLEHIISSMQAHRPKHLPKYAEICLDKLAETGLGAKISLGGAFGLMHYHEYRPTHDVDAWWQAKVSAEERRQVADVLQDALTPFGEVRTRSWGDVLSVELYPDDELAFSFQIAERSAHLNPPAPSPWRGIFLDSFDDLVAAKMVALVERGAPRDFVDIYTLCREGLVSPGRCWELWSRRQELAKDDMNSDRARLAVQTHLARIEQHRPLEGITDPSDRENAERLRGWFREDFFVDLP